MARNTKNFRSFEADMFEADLADLGAHENAPSQIEFYAFFGIAFLLLMAGGVLAICLAVMS